MSSTTRYLLIVLAIIVVIVLGVYLFNTNNTQNSSVTPTTTGTQNTTTTIETTIVTYTDSGFSPQSVTITQGQTVRFQNAGTDNIRVGSDPHPLHNGYPTTGGCISSTFDSCSPITPGSSWSFTFGVKGTWGYHDHLHPSRTGTVIVQ